jgi:ribosome maturation factor RimP
LQRTIKDVHEFSAFIGKEVQVLMKDSVDWFSGTLFKVKDNSSIIILSDGEEKEISFDDLNKVKLVYNWEDSK